MEVSVSPDPERGPPYSDVYNRFNRSESVWPALSQVRQDSTEPSTSGTERGRGKIRNGDHLKAEAEAHE